MKGINIPSSFIKNGRLAYKTLYHDSNACILVGFLIGNSANKDSFMLHYFVQCLYEPFITYNLSLGDRIGSHWEVRDLPKLNQIIDNFNKFDDLNKFDDFISFLEYHPYYGQGAGKNNYYALTHFIQKNYDKSLHFLNEIVDLKNHSNPEWFDQDIKNAEYIKSCILDNNYLKGINQILEWQNETAKAVKLKI